MALLKSYQNEALACHRGLGNRYVIIKWGFDVVQSSRSCDTSRTDTAETNFHLMDPPQKNSGRYFQAVFFTTIKGLVQEN